MPELPEVEVICRGLSPRLHGRRIEDIAFSEYKLRSPRPSKASLKLIKGQKIISVSRRAKYLIINLENSAIMLIHLGMTGRLGLFPKGVSLLKHDHVRWRLDNGLELRYHDTRRFGSIRIVGPDKDIASLFAGQGPDPFWPSFSAEYLAEKARGRTLPVKNFLMDNRIVTGIGNIYACEILFSSRINPQKATGDLGLRDWRNIVEKSRKILKEAIECGGSSVSDYVDSSGEKGYFQIKLKAYGRSGRPCRVCGGAIQKKILGGRASFFCPSCQPI